ncbi:MAG: ABC transporter permease [Tepidisphaeraceae bacterium]
MPVAYNVRNLVQRKGTTLMTAVGIGLTVAVLVVAVALTVGLSSVFSGTGDARQFLVLRKGTDAELSSTVSSETYQIVRRLPGIAKDESGEPMVSPEAITVVNLPNVDMAADAETGMNVTVRGMTPIGYKMRPFELIDGRKAADGVREVIVGENVAKRYPAARLGNEIRFGRGLWKVVGVFRSGETAANSEIWTDLNQLRGDFEQQGGSSSLLVRAEIDAPTAEKQIAAANAATAKAKAERAAAVKAAVKSAMAKGETEIAAQAAAETAIPAATIYKADFISNFKIQDDQRLNANVLAEKDYYAGMTMSGVPLMVLGYFVSVVMAVGSGFAATNTMYAAVARRGREIGTLRALGFSRFSILRSFVLESVCLALLGGIVGVLIALPINGVTTGVGSFATFSETAFKFKVGPMAIGIGLAFAAVIGALGGLLPAWAASRTSIVAAMREG